MITDEQLKEIEELAGLCFGYSDICLKTGLKLNTFKKELLKENSAVNIAYHRGKLTAEIEIRRQLFKSAKMGSPAAQEATIKLRQAQNIDEKIN